MFTQNREKSHRCDFKTQKSSHECDFLTESQQRAIELLLLGKTQKEVAAKIGVCREVISRWSNHNPAFIASLNERREQLQTESAELVISLQKAVHLIEQVLVSGCCLEDSEVKAALNKIKTFLSYSDLSSTQGSATLAETILNSIVR